MGASTERRIEAAGGVLWRPSSSGEPEIAVVHRPKYNDWSLPKGKLNRLEHPVVAAVREVEEETGYKGRPGRSLGEIHYLKDGIPKRVSYWAIEAVSGEFGANDEVDDIKWLPPAEALLQLQPDRDQPIVEAFVSDARATTPFVIVRHGSAGERSSFNGDDDQRPLDDAGRRQALNLVAVLEAFGVERVVTADVLRCRETVEPFLFVRRLAAETEALFSETGYAAKPERAAERLVTLLSGPATAVCSQGKVIPALLQRVCAQLSARAVWDGTVAKGGFVVLNIAGEQKSPVASVDRYRPVA
ncbi:MAG TPA: NUDIX hydrolase [Acidothermaceae bacterium]|jgi:8-oxo-dGTP diphosphatase